MGTQFYKLLLNQDRSSVSSENVSSFGMLYDCDTVWYCVEATGKYDCCLEWYAPGQCHLYKEGLVQQALDFGPRYAITSI